MLPNQKYLLHGVISLILPLFLSFPAGAQAPTPEAAEKARLIDLAENRLTGNRKALDSVFARLERIAGGSGETLSILHLGDSHIQAGYLTNATRARLQHDFGNAGRGLIVPLHLMRTNEPEGYRIDSPNAWTGSRCAVWNVPLEVGIGGVAITTQQARAEFTLKSPGNPFNSVTVFHHAQAPMLVEDSLLSVGFYCSAGNSDRSTRIVLDRLTDSVTLRADLSREGFRTQTFYGFSLENGLPGVLYHSAGVNGNCYEYINRSPAIAAQSALLHPDLIILSLGTNDAYVTRFNAAHVWEQIDRLIAALQEANPEAAILLTTPMEFCTRRRVNGALRYTPNKNVTAVRNQIIRAAEARGLPYWDLYRVARGEGAMARWFGAKLAHTDRIHLLREGYELQGELLYRALSGALRDHTAQRPLLDQQVAAPDLAAVDAPQNAEGPGRIDDAQVAGLDETARPEVGQVDDVDAAGLSGGQP